MRIKAGITLVAVAVLASACESTDFRIDPLLYTDTVEIAVPTEEANAGLPSALDVTVSAGRIRGGVFPERSTQAGEWDLALRRRGAELSLVPARMLGMQTRPAVTRALLDETFGSLREAPGRSAFLADSAVLLEQGRVYAVRSRVVTSIYGTGCEQYAKLQPLAVDPALGRARLQIVTNERCNDPRLVLEDD